jgi:hypothetical protein
MKYILDREAVKALNEAEVHWKDSILGMTVKGLWNFSWWMGGRLSESLRTTMLQGKAALYAGVYVKACNDAMAKLGPQAPSKDLAPGSAEKPAEIDTLLKSLKIYKDGVLPALDVLEEASGDAPAQPAQPAAQPAPAGAAPDADAAQPASGGATAPEPPADARLTRQQTHELVRQYPYLQAENLVRRLDRKRLAIEAKTQADPNNVALEQSLQDLLDQLKDAKGEAIKVRADYTRARAALLQGQATNESAQDAETGSPDAALAHGLALYLSANKRLGQEGLDAIFNMRERDGMRDSKAVRDFVELASKLPYTVDGDSKPDEPAHPDEPAQEAQEAQDAQANEGMVFEDAQEEEEPARDITAAWLVEIVREHNRGQAGRFVGELRDSLVAVLDLVQELSDDAWEHNDDTRIGETFAFPPGMHLELLKESGDYSKSFKTFLGSKVLGAMLAKYPKTPAFKELATSLVNVKRLKRYQYEASIYYSERGKTEQHGHTLPESDKRVTNPNLEITWKRLMMRLDDQFQFHIDVDEVNAKVEVVVLDKKTTSSSEADAALYLDGKKAGVTEYVRKMVGYDGTTVYGFGVRNDYGSGYAIMRKVKDARHMGIQAHWYKLFGVYEFGEEGGMKRSGMLGATINEACKTDGFVYVAFSTTSTTAGKKPAYFYDKKGRMIMKQPHNMDDPEVLKEVTDSKNTNPTTSDAFRSMMAKGPTGVHWRQVGVTLRGIVDATQVLRLYRLDLSKDIYKQEQGLETAKDNHTKLVKVFQSLSTATGDDGESANESLDQGPNDESQIMAREYDEKLKEYQANKDKLAQVLAKPPQDWEKLAEPLINNNVYLGAAWRIAKLTRSLNSTKELLPTKQGGDLQRAQDDLRSTTKELTELQAELKKRMDEDRGKMQAA